MPPKTAKKNEKQLEQFLHKDTAYSHAGDLVRTAKKIADAIRKSKQKLAKDE